MEYYTSDSCDSDSREQKTLSLCCMELDTAAMDKELDAALAKRNNASTYEILYLYTNRLEVVPESISKFSNLKIVDLSGNNLAALPEVLVKFPISNLIVKNNNITNDGLPKCMTSWCVTMKELNLSGNKLTSFPEQLLDLASLRYLYLSANKISDIPYNIDKLMHLQILSMASNEISEVPPTVSRLRALTMLILNNNNIEHLPGSIANLLQLKSLKLHNNRIRTLPTQIVKLKHLSELSLRENPLIVRFIRDMTLQPPSLLELAGRSIKLHRVRVQDGDIPETLKLYLRSAHCCVNPKCKGVFFDNRVEHIKFVDFCGMYRVPLLQFLCSSRCIVGSWESRELEAPPHPNIMRKVLLG